MDEYQVDGYYQTEKILRKKENHRDKSSRFQPLHLNANAARTKRKEKEVSEGGIEKTKERKIS